MVVPRVALLLALSEYRFLNTDQILALGHRVRNLQRRLHDLYHAGYVERPPSKSFLLSLLAIWFIASAQKGRVFFEDAEERAEKIRQIKLNQQTTFPYISHALMIFQFRAVITLALEKEKAKRK